MKRSHGEGWELWLGDTVKAATAMESQSVDASVFSPPFASLYTYSSAAEDMGNCGSHAEFFEHYGYLVEQQARVMKPGRNVCIHCMQLPTSKERDGVIGLVDFRGEIVRLYQRHGFTFHSEVTIWKDPVTAMQRTKALGLLWKQIKKDSAMSRQGIADYVVTMRAPGKNSIPVAHTEDEFPVAEWQKWASPVWMDIDPSDTLQYTTARDSEDERHICPLQLGVIRRCIGLWSNRGELVWSPFAGIGSEGYVALQMGRRFVGAELKPSYARIAEKNLREALKWEQHSLFEAPRKIEAKRKSRARAVASAELAQLAATGESVEAQPVPKSEAAPLLSALSSFSPRGGLGTPESERSDDLPPVDPASLAAPSEEEIGF